MPGLEGWMLLAEAAQRYEVSVERLKKAARRGLLRATKLGDGLTVPYVVKAVDVEYYLKTSRRGRPPKVKPAAKEPTDG